MPVTGGLKGRTEQGKEDRDLSCRGDVREAARGRKEETVGNERRGNSLLIEGDGLKKKHSVLRFSEQGLEEEKVGRQGTAEGGGV